MYAFLFIYVNLQSEFDETEPTAPPPEQSVPEIKDQELELPEDLNLDGDGNGDDDEQMEGENENLDGKCLLFCKPY